MRWGNRTIQWCVIARKITIALPTYADVDQSVCMHHRRTPECHVKCLSTVFLCKPHGSHQSHGLLDSWGKYSRIFPIMRFFCRERSYLNYGREWLHPWPPSINLAPWGYNWSFHHSHQSSRMGLFSLSTQTSSSLKGWDGHGYWVVVHGQRFSWSWGYG